MLTPKNPKEFNAITAFFVPYFDEVYSSLEDMIDCGWQSLLEDECKNAKAFLDELLSGKYSEEQLRDVWQASDAAISPFRGNEGNCREFLELIQSRYDKFDRSFRGGDEDLEMS